MVGAFEVNAERVIHRSEDSAKCTGAAFLAHAAPATKGVSPQRCQPFNCALTDEPVQVHRFALLPASGSVWVRWWPNQQAWLIEALTCEKLPQKGVAAFVPPLAGRLNKNSSPLWQTHVTPAQLE